MCAGSGPVPLDAHQAFATMDELVVPWLDASGPAPMGEAIQKGLQLIRERKEIYKRSGIEYFHPRLVLITGGVPRDRDWRAAAADVRRAQRNNEVIFYAVGVDGADLQPLAEYCIGSPPITLKELDFTSLSFWFPRDSVYSFPDIPSGVLPTLTWGTVPSDGASERMNTVASLTPFADVEMADNPSPRCPVVLLLDVSSSMAGNPIQQLNEGLRVLAADMQGDELASMRVEVAVIAFGATVSAMDVRGNAGPISLDADTAFVTMDEFVAPWLAESGLTPMGEATRKGLQLVRERKDIYKRYGIDYFRPWIFLISDGAPNDSGWQAAAQEAQRAQRNKETLFFAVGVEGADLNTLAMFCTDYQPVMLQGLDFTSLFQWMSKSLSRASSGEPGAQVSLPPLTWGSVPT